MALQWQETIIKRLFNGTMKKKDTADGTGYGMNFMIML
jgi:hypothetical protein